MTFSFGPLPLTGDYTASFWAQAKLVTDWPVDSTATLDVDNVGLMRTPAPLVWTGGAGGDDHWTTAANWGGTTPLADACLNFGVVGAGGHASNHNDFTAGTNFCGITFTSGAPAYNLEGNLIKLEGDVVNQSNSDHTISLDIALASAVGTFNTGVQKLIVGGRISGTGPLTKAGAGTLVLSGLNTYTDATVVTAGTLQEDALGALPSGSSLTIGAGGTVVLASGLTASSGCLGVCTRALAAPQSSVK